MSKRNTTAPLKAYEVYEVEYDWRGIPKEFVFGVYVGRTPGQARWQAARDRMSGGFYNPFPGLRSRRVENRQAIEDYEDRGKYWRDTRRAQRSQARADAFNAACPVGSAVRVFACVEARTWPEGLTATRTPAWLANKDQVLVSVEGYSGGFDLKHIQLLPTT